MVTVLPQKTDVGSAIGAGLGQGLGQGFAQGANIGFQRNLLQGALQKVKDIRSNPKSTPFDLATALMEATAGIPGAERYLPQLYQSLLPELQANQQKNIPLPGQPEAFGQGATPTSASSAQFPRLQMELPKAVTTLGEGFENIGLGVGQMPSTYSPEQYRQVQQQYLSAGLDPTQALNEMQRQDQIAQQRFGDLEKAAVEQAEFSTFMRDKLKDLNLADEDFAVAERASLNPRIRNLKNPTLKADAVRKKMQLFQKAKKGFKDSAERFNFDQNQYNDQIRTLQRDARVMIDNGQRDMVERDLSKAEWGPVEKEKILNPLPESIEKGIRALPKLEDINKQITVLPDDPRYDEQARKAFQDREQREMKYKDFIAKNFKTGEYDFANIVEPGTSLLLLRDEAMKNGVGFREFQRMIHDLENSGQIVLDEYQQAERPYLSKHPMQSLGLGEILFRVIPTYINRQ